MGVLALLVLVELEDVDVNLVLEVLMEVSVEVHVSTVEGVELLVLGMVAEHLMFPMLVELDDVGDVAISFE
eukprot:2251312-Amphidinium_carterae.1